MASEIQKMAEKPYQRAFVVANVCISHRKIHIERKTLTLLH